MIIFPKQAEIIYVGTLEIYTGDIFEGIIGVSKERARAL